MMSGSPMAGASLELMMRPNGWIGFERTLLMVTRVLVYKSIAVRTLALLRTGCQIGSILITLTPGGVSLRRVNTDPRCVLDGLREGSYLQGRYEQVSFDCSKSDYHCTLNCHGHRCCWQNISSWNDLGGLFLFDQHCYADKQPWLLLSFAITLLSVEVFFFS
jgi:hypothetical protein